MTKFERLKKILTDMESVLIAFSGGTDSTLLLKTALDTLGSGNVLAVTAVSPVMTRRELGDVRALARSFGARLKIVQGSEMANPRFVRNDPGRCYWCKRDRFRALKNIGRMQGLRCVIEGSNTDDLGDYRPGMKAVKELAIRSPLLEAGLGKQEIRRISRRLGLPTWDKPAAACLASRIPYGTRIDGPLLKRIEAAEEILHRAGFPQVRLRHHGAIARIEVPSGRIASLAAPALRNRLTKALRKLGWHHVALDLEGYCMGSLNRVVRGIKK